MIGVWVSMALGFSSIPLTLALLTCCGCFDDNDYREVIAERRSELPELDCPGEIYVLLLGVDAGGGVVTPDTGGAPANACRRRRRLSEVSCTAALEEARRVVAQHGLPLPEGK